MIRKTLTILSLLGLLLSVGLWGVSLWRLSYIWQSKDSPNLFLFSVSSGSFLYLHFDQGMVDDQGMMVDFPGGGELSFLGFQGFEVPPLPNIQFRSATGAAVTLRLPLWLGMLPCLGCFALSFLRRRRRRMRRKACLCLNCGYRLKGLTEPRCPECDTPFCLACGYDLRGSKERCPECGQEF